jgi:hypothetical protein
MYTIKSDQFKAEHFNTFCRTAIYCKLTMCTIQGDQFKVEHFNTFCITAIYCKLTMNIIQGDKFKAQHSNDYCRAALYCTLTINIIQRLFYRGSAHRRNNQHSPPSLSAAISSAKFLLKKPSVQKYVYFQVKPAGSTTTEDIADIDSNRVSIDLPGQLFGSLFSLTTKVSQIIADLLLVSQSYIQQPSNPSVNFKHIRR